LFIVFTKPSDAVKFWVKIQAFAHDQVDPVPQTGALAHILSSGPR
jgi:hypothetical protein